LIDLLAPHASPTRAGADLKAIAMPTGSRLLADGWWGVSRHINYLGDWMLALGMSLATGASSNRRTAAAAWPQSNECRVVRVLPPATSAAPPPRPPSAGVKTPLTYFYPFYFAILLLHRERRDEHKCAAKYGAAWAEYTRRVPYRIVPWLY
jgi:delta14-sterol reductase